MTRVVRFRNRPVIDLRSALVLVLVSLAASAPAVAPMKTFQPTEKIVAADVNANFKALADAVSALE